MYNALVFIHLACAIVWMGGMAFMLLALRPVAGEFAFAIFALVEIFLELAPFALQFTILIQQITLTANALDFTQCGRIFLIAIGGGLEGSFDLIEFFFARLELGIQPGLRRLACRGVTQYTVQIDHADLELLAMNSQRAQQHAANNQGLENRFHDQNTEPIWN